MLCPQCRFDSPDGMRFCGHCGWQIGERCGACGFLNPGGFNYCGHCGTRLERLTETPGQPPERGVPAPTPPAAGPIAHTAAAAPSQAAAISEGERRRVTILFADVTGFTSLSGQLDPEEVYGIMNRCFELLGQVIAQYAGTVDKYIGDCVMALFGAPVSHGNDPERAVRAALAMQQEMVSFGEEIRAQTGAPLAMRIGLNSGIVIAGAVGSSQKRQYTVMGDAVNVASRIESAAKPGRVLVSESVYRQANRYFRFEAWEPIRVKGKEEPLPVYEVGGEKEAAPAPVGAPARQGSLFVGRQKEMETLENALAQAETGRGRVAQISGEAGMGKSRLLEEFLSLTAAREAVCWHGSAHSNEAESPYAVWRQILSRFCGVESGEYQEQRRKALDSLTAIEPALAEWLPYLGSVFGWPPDSDERDAGTTHRATQQAIRHLALALAEKRGLVLAIDDVQWADALSLDMLSLLVRDAAASRLLLVIAYRPDFAPAWDQTEAISIPLKALGRAESAAIASSLLGGEIPSFIRNLAFEQAGGNPFFLEETIRTLIEENVLVRVENQWRLSGDPGNARTPETLEAAVTARIDRLAPEAKNTLQYASVIGRAFPVDVLRQATGSNGRTASALAGLESAELIEEISPPPSWEYGFPQAVIREVAYGMMLAPRRKQYHEAVARALESLRPTRLEDHYEALAYHYSNAHCHAEAIFYSLKAGEKSLRLFAIASASRYFGDTLSLIEGFPPEDRSRWAAEVFRCHEALGDCATLTGSYADAIARYRQALRETPPAAPDAPRIKRKIGNVCMRQADFEEAVRWLREGYAEAGDPRESAKILSEMAGVYYRKGDYTEAADLAAQGLAIAEGIGGYKEISDCCLILGVLRLSDNDYEQANAYLRRSLSLREAIGDLVGIASALNNLGSLALEQGRYREADEFYRRSYEARARIGHSEGMGTALSNRGNVAYDLGRYEQAEAFYREAIDLSERIGNAYVATIAHLNLGRTLLACRRPEARICLEKALSDASRSGFKDILALAHAGMSSLLLADGQPEQASSEAGEAFRVACDLGSRFHQGVALRALSAALLALGRFEDARSQLTESLEHFQSIGAELEAGRTCAEMAKITEDDNEARGFRQQAEAIFRRLEAGGDLNTLLQNGPDASLSPP